MHFMHEGKFILQSFSCYDTLNISKESNSYSNLKTETVFSVIYRNRSHAKRGIYRIELLARREPEFQGTINAAISRKGEKFFALPGELHCNREREGQIVMKGTGKKKKNGKKNSITAAKRRADYPNSGEIAYQNKDIASKLLAEYIKGKTFRVYGLDVPEVRAVLPTNIPIVRANELRLDNLFELADGTVALVDYESEYKKRIK